MRLETPFVYRMTDLGKPQPIFSTIASATGLDSQQMYATFNMGVGFAVFVRQADAQKCVEIAAQVGQKAWIGGSVVFDGGRKAVELVPLDISYEAQSLRVR
jgi:phosphoribosylformylglycinamidine cyclo-ligase